MNAQSRIAFVVATFSLIGCPELVDKPLDLTCTSNDSGMSPADMAIAPAKCAAAKGLSGDNLLCVDFDKITQLADPALAGWDFTASMLNCPGWHIVGNTLSIKSFGTFMGECGFLLPAFDFKASDRQKYQFITLSLIHKVSLAEPDQKAQLFLGQADPNTRLLIQANGKNQRQQTTITLAKNDLPVAVNSVYQLLLKLNSGVAAGGTVTGWQIESIAVNAGL